MDLSTPWLGLRLKNPLIVGASPLDSLLRQWVGAAPPLRARRAA